MLDTFLSDFTREAKQAGIGRLEFYIKECEDQTVQVYKQEVERVSLSSETLVYIEGEYQGYKGSTFVESVGTARIGEHLDLIRQIATYNKEPFRPRPSLSQSLGVPERAQEASSIDEIARWLRLAEQRAYDSDRRVDNVGTSSHTTHRERITLANDQGDRLEDFVQFEQARMSIVARDGDKVQSTFESRLATSIAQEELTSLADQGARKVVSQLDASPVKTGQYAVILQNSLVCDLVLAFLPGVYADRVQKKMSVLAGKVGTRIVSPLFHLLEDPNLPGGIVTRRVDDEGTPTEGKSIIEEGQLTTFLHNLETARALQLHSTGNGFKNLYREPPAIAATNLYIPGGTHTLVDLMQEMRHGLLITDCDGIFAGANPVSGDFSLIAKGYLIEEGSIQRAVNQITIGGNFYEMLNELRLIGREYDTGGSLHGFIQAPALLINKLFVSGI